MKNSFHFLKAKTTLENKPIFFDLAAGDQQKIKKYLQHHPHTRVVDTYLEQLKELYEINHPQEVGSQYFNKNFQNYLSQKTAGKDLALFGKWVALPWQNSLVHILPEKDFFAVRTARNKNLITQQEQEKFYKAKIGIAGLSVGSSVALAIVLQGGAKQIKLADFDSLELSNTNRIRASVGELGEKKVEITARQIYEINPYAQIQIFNNGLNEKNVSSFCKGLDVIIDEVDNLAIKFLLRIQAKKLRLPVLMAADNGNNGVIDIERYDKIKKLKFFHGRLGEITYKNLTQLNKIETGRLIVKNIGPENINQRTYESFMEIGKSLVSWPQLGGAALINGSMVAYCVRQIINNHALIQGRGVVNIDSIITPDYFSKIQTKRRHTVTKKYKKILGL